MYHDETILLGMNFVQMNYFDPIIDMQISHGNKMKRLQCQEQLVLLSHVPSCAEAAQDSGGTWRVGTMMAVSGKEGDQTWRGWRV